MNDEMVLAEESQQYGPTEQHVLDILSQLPSDSIVRNYVNAISRYSDTHVGHHLLGGLEILSQLVPSHIYFPFGTTPVYANLFAMIVGSSGSRKTVAVSAVRRILKAVSDDVVADPPGSREGLFQIVSDFPKRFIPYSEFGDFLSSTGARSYLAPLRTAYNDAADSQPLTRTRVRRRNRDGSMEDGDGLGCENPRVSLLGAVATPFLDEHTNASDWTGGFFARFLTSCYERERTIALPEDGDTFITERVVPILRLHFNKWNRPMPFEPQIHFARCGGFDRDGKADYTRWVKSMEQRDTTSSAAVEASTNRLGPLAAKIAMLLAWDAMAPRWYSETGEPEYRGIPFGTDPAANDVKWQIPNYILHVAAQIVQDIHYKSVCKVVTGLADTPQERLVVMVQRALDFADGNFWKYRDGGAPRGALVGALTLGQLSKELRRDQRDISNAIVTLRTRGDVGMRESAGGGGQRFYLIGGAVDRMVSIEAAQAARDLGLGG